MTPIPAKTPEAPTDLETPATPRTDVSKDPSDPETPAAPTTDRSKETSVDESAEASGQPEDTTNPNMVLGKPIPKTTHIPVEFVNPNMELGPGFATSDEKVAVDGDEKEPVEGGEDTPPPSPKKKADGFKGFFTKT